MLKQLYDNKLKFSKCYKRRNEEENNCDDDGNFDVDTKSFKSAKEQLMLDSTKQQQQQPHQQQQQQQSNYYSLAKRPMNNPPAKFEIFNVCLKKYCQEIIKSVNTASLRRGVHSKFNLPIRSNEEESNQQNFGQSNGNSSCLSNNQSKGVQGAEIASLKNIDQKLVEIIMSEVEISLHINQFLNSH